MKITTLRSLVKQGESENLEFKKTTGEIQDAAKTICAFLNSQHGGIVLIGVTDDKKIIGQTVEDSTKKKIVNELNRIEPKANIAISYVPVDGNLQVIVLTVKPDDQAPYLYDGRAYTRNQSTNAKMSRDEYDHLYYKKRPTRWEGLSNTQCTINDLDKNRIKEVVRIANAAGRLHDVSPHTSIRGILDKLNLMVDDGLTNAAVILFCSNERKQFMQSEVRMARFKGITKSEFIDNKVFRGNAFELFEKAMNFLGEHIPVAGKIVTGNPYRVDTPAIPFEVLREALVNAFCHRDYSLPGGDVAIAVYDNRVEISNSGSLPPGMTIALLKKTHRSVPRNERIAHVFYLCRMIEKWGRGTEDIINICKAAGNPSPKFEEMSDSFWVTLPFKEFIHAVDIANDTRQLTLRQLSKRQQEILMVLASGQLARQQIMEQMSTSTAITNRMMQLELSKLRKLGLITPEGRGPATVWHLINREIIAK